MTTQTSIKLTINGIDVLYFTQDNQHNSQILDSILNSFINTNTTNKTTTKTIPYTKIKEDSEETCIICMDQFKKGLYKKTLTCQGKHEFHKKCVDKWFKKSMSKTCPICRSGL